jgi:hypothetical protein
MLHVENCVESTGSSTELLIICCLEGDDDRQALVRVDQIMTNRE